MFDFADIFEVKAHDIRFRGDIDTNWNPINIEFIATYWNGDFERRIICRLHCAQSRIHVSNGQIHFPITLPPGGSWHTCCYLIPVLRGVEKQPVYEGHQAASGHSRLDLLQRQWNESATKITTPNVDVQRAFDQAVSDMGALRLHEHDLSDELWMPAAGVPWFVAVFGRDSLIVSFQNMLVSCPLANGTLQRLASFQATECDDWRDMQPGKILHELRFGELAHFKRIPHIPYYGTADATSLFVILLSEAFLWTGDERILNNYRDNAPRCLEWIDRFGDLDGDGFQEFKTFSPQGDHNMGWKDSGDAVSTPTARKSTSRSRLASCKATSMMQNLAWRRYSRFWARLRPLDSCASRPIS